GASTDVLILAAVQIIHTAYGDPFAEACSDHGIGSLYLDDVIVCRMQPIIVGTESDGRAVAIEANGGIETRCHIVIFSLPHHLAIDIGRSRGQRDALAGLNQNGMALTGRDHPGTVVGATGFAADNTGLVAASRAADD